MAGQVVAAVLGVFVPVVALMLLLRWWMQMHATQVLSSTIPPAPNGRSWEFPFGLALRRLQALKLLRRNREFNTEVAVALDALRAAKSEGFNHASGGSLAAAKKLDAFIREYFLDLN